MRGAAVKIKDPGYGQIDTEYAIRLGATPVDDDGPIWMVNLMKYREVADYSEYRGEDAPVGISGRRADSLYSPLDVLNDIGAEVAFFGDVVDQFFNPDPQWDRVAVIKYPSRHDYITMLERPDYLALHHHKEAGLERTIVAGCLPMPQPAYPEGLGEVPWDEVAHPPTTDDAPVVAVHVLHFDEAAIAALTPAEMEAYQRTAATAGLPNGLRVNGWFAVEGTFVGDGRPWHQIRFNEFPSRAAFMAMYNDPARLEAQATHRTNAIADTYTLLVRANANRLSELR